MKWKQIENSYDDAECSECGIEQSEGQTVYWKKNKGEAKGIIMCMQCYKRYGSNADAQAATTTATTTTATTAATTPPSSPPVEGWAKGHDENMKSAELTRVAVQALTAAIVDLMRVEADRNALLKKGLEAKA